MSVHAARLALAKLLLPHLTPGVIPPLKSNTFATLKSEGHAESDIAAALFEMCEAGHAREEPDRNADWQRIYPGHAAAGPGIRPTRRYPIIRPMSPLHDWWKDQTETIAQLDDLAREAEKLHQTARSEQAIRDAAANRHRTASDALERLKSSLFDLQNYLGQTTEAFRSADSTRGHFLPVATAIIHLGGRLRSANYLPDLNTEFPVWAFGSRWQEPLGELNGLISLQYAWKLLAFAWSTGDTDAAVNRLGQAFSAGGLGRVRLWLEVLPQVILDREGNWSQESSREQAARPEPAVIAELKADTAADVPKKKRKRPPANIGRLLALKKAIEKGAKKGLSQRESALEFTDGDERKADTLLRSFRRHRENPGLS